MSLIGTTDLDIVVADQRADSNQLCPTGRSGMHMDELSDIEVK